jgi:hypothetical protein
MENPACWNEIQKAIFEAMQEHDRSIEEGCVGGSDVLYIYNKLKAKGMLKEKDE